MPQHGCATSVPPMPWDSFAQYIGDRWNEFWTWANTQPLGVQIVGGVIAAAVLPALVAMFASWNRLVTWRAPRRRPRWWEAVKRGFGAIVTLRLTTKGRLRSREELAYQLGRKDQRIETQRASDPHKIVFPPFLFPEHFQTQEEWKAEPSLPAGVARGDATRAEVSWELTWSDSLIPAQRTHHRVFRLTNISSLEATQVLLKRPYGGMLQFLDDSTTDFGEHRWRSIGARKMEMFVARVETSHKHLNALTFQVTWQEGSTQYSVDLPATYSVT